MRVERVDEASDDVVGALGRLLPQLSPTRPTPTLEELSEIVGRPDTDVLVAIDDGRIVGTLTLLVLRIPGRIKGRIEAVVVDASARGRGVGEALTRAALARARAAGASEVELTSRPEREAANRLYRRLGFMRHATNVYIWRDEGEQPR